MAHADSSGSSATAGPDGLAELLEQFEVAWRSATPPRIEDFVARLEGQPAPALIQELVKIDLEYRWRRAADTADFPAPAGALPAPPRLEDYVARLTELGPLDWLPVALIAEEYRVRQRWGDHPEHEEYRRRFPQAATLEEALRRIDAELHADTLHKRPLSPPTRLDAGPCAAPRRCPADEETRVGELDITPGPPRPPLDVFPQYELLDEIGRGGMGIVYKARHRGLDRIVALKVIRSEHQDDAEAVHRFLREARAAARLAHPHIVGIHDAGQAAGWHFLVMEFIAGVDLARVVARWGRLPIARACECIRQAALGLQHAHERGLVHRDIKPANLLLRTDPEVLGTPGSIPGTEQPSVLIADFGLALLKQAGSESMFSLTGHGNFLGTPDFMAPEQAEDSRAADIRSDLYSLGCTLYFLLTGKVPFPGPALVHKLDAHRWSAPTPVRKLRPEVPVSVQAILDKLMAKRPEDRYQVPADLVAALERLDLRDQAEKETNARVGSSPADISRLGSVDVPPAPIFTECRWFLGHAGPVQSVAIATGGHLAASAGGDGALRLWDLATGAEVGRCGGHSDGVLSVAFTPDGRSLVSGGRDGTLRLWDVASAREVGWLEAHTGAVASLAVAPDGRRVLSGGQDQRVRLWDLATWHEVQPLGGSVVQRHWDEVLAVAFLPDGDRALTASRDLTLRLWDLAKGQQVLCMRGPSLPIACVAVSPDGRQALSGGGNGVRLWDLATGQLLRRFEGHDRPVLGVAFAPDGRRAVSGSADGTLRLWDTAAGRELCCLVGHRAEVRSVAFTPDGRRVLSGGADRMVGVWELPAC